MLIGHEKIFQKLRSQALAGKLHHAQLFLGPEHVGKTKLALELAAIMQGAEKDVVLRKQILEGKDADTLLFLDNGEHLSIKEIREIVERASQSHYRHYLIVIIENIGRMKLEAMNALLKTLEEPHEDTVFFLTANREDDIIPTIKSRAQITHFNTVSDEVLKGACDNNVYDQHLVMYAMGRPGKLRKLLNDQEYFQAHQEMHEQVLRFLDNPETHSAMAISRTYEKSELIQELLDILLHRARTFALTSDRPPVLEHVDFTKVMDEIEVVKQDLERNVNKKLLLENLLLTFAQ